MKKLFAILLAFALVFGVGVSVASAQVPPGSLALAIDFTYVDINNHNCGLVINLADAKANSGFNFVGGEKAVLTTGNAKAETETTTGANSSLTAGMLTDSQSGPIAINLNSGLGGFDADVLPGPFFYNPLAIAADIKLVDVDNFNGGFVLNDSLASANTGWNMAFGYKASITSGNAAAGTKTTTNLNSNATYVALSDTGLVGPVAANVDFDYGLNGLGGFGSLAAAVEADVVLVDNLNFGAVMNFSGANANSGLNFAGRKGVINTGKATASTETTTTMNTNATGVVIADAGLVGPVAGNVDFDIVEVGAGCLPLGDMAIALDLNLASVNNLNLGMVVNDSGAFANTGLNAAGAKSKITTGAAVASTTTGSTVNSNTTGVVIADYSSGPIAGNVNIDLYPACADEMDAPCHGGFGGVGPIAANVNTMGGVSIAADANLAYVDNTNIAMVDNTSVAMANSGMNKTGEEGTITTGKATASTATTNTVNTNETMVVIADGSGVGPVAANIEGGNSTSIAAEVTVADVDNTNKAEVTNVSTADANTGGNVSSGGQSCVSLCCGSTDGGSVTTGAATATTTTTNTVNTNTTTFVINQ